MKKALGSLARGKAFEHGGQRWIALEHDLKAKRALCLTKDIVESKCFDSGQKGDFSQSSSKRYLNGPFLDNLIDKVGDGRDFLETEIDLRDFGACKATIFLLSSNQYHRNRDIIPATYGGWWLSNGTKLRGLENLARMVGVTGSTYLCKADSVYGLRPACYMSLDAMVEAEDDVQEETNEGDVSAERAAAIIKELAEEYGGTFATEEQFRAAMSFTLGALRVKRLGEDLYE